MPRLSLRACRRLPRLGRAPRRGQSKPQQLSIWKPRSMLRSGTSISAAGAVLPLARLKKGTEGNRAMALRSNFGPARRRIRCASHPTRLGMADHRQATSRPHRRCFSPRRCPGGHRRGHRSQSRIILADRRRAIERRRASIQRRALGVEVYQELRFTKPCLTARATGSLVVVRRMLCLSKV